jgi:hypothetical protein
MQLTTIRFLPLLLALLPVAQAQDLAPTVPTESKAPAFTFSLLPNSLQKNPLLASTVLTEVTKEGKKLPVASRERPAYFLAHSGGYREMGDFFGQPTLPDEAVEATLVRALAANGYLPADAAHPPSLMIIYSWGAHSPPPSEVESPVEKERNALESAALVGGDRMVVLIRREWESEHLTGFADPINLYRLSSSAHDFMLNQITDDLYFVVASAYSYPDMLAKRRVLLWRSRMTVASAGVSQQGSLPALIMSAAPYFGREMNEPAVTRRRQEGRVDIGTLRTLEDGDSLRPAGSIPPLAAPAP